MGHGSEVNRRKITQFAKSTSDSAEQLEHDFPNDGVVPLYNFSTKL
jgi:hypothetical protein